MTHHSHYSPNRYALTQPRYPLIYIPIENLFTILPPIMPRLFLIRHGETVDNVAGLYAGSRDSP